MENVRVSGFPLPPSLETTAYESLETRLQRLEGSGDRPPLITFAVGGAGAHAARARVLVKALAGLLKEGRVRLALVAGLHSRLAERYRRWITGELGSAASAVEVAEASDFEILYRSFNSLLERTDVLWTKPSELSFYAALGLPIILDDPIGDHERANARLVLSAAAGVAHPPAQTIEKTILSWLTDGTLSRCAQHGFERLPRGGTARIAAITLSAS
jgi:UDP-N-acetylglucosamine:LPS N-acetylglucosamine transferase